MNFFRRGNSVDSKRDLTRDQQIDLITRALEDQRKLIDQLVKLEDLSTENTSKRTGRSSKEPRSSKHALEDGELSSGSTEKETERILSPNLKRWNNRAILELNKGEMTFELDKSQPEDSDIEDELERHIMDSQGSNRDQNNSSKQKASSPISSRSPNVQPDKASVSNRAKDTVLIDGKLFQYKLVQVEERKNLARKTTFFHKKEESTDSDESDYDTFKNQMGKYIKKEQKYKLQTSVNSGNEKTLTFFSGKPTDNLDNGSTHSRDTLRRVVFTKLNRLISQ